MKPLLLLALLFVAVAYSVAAWIYCRRLNAETDEAYARMAQSVCCRLNARYGGKFSIVRRRRKFFLYSEGVLIGINLTANELYETLRKYEIRVGTLL